MCNVFCLSLCWNQECKSGSCSITLCPGILAPTLSRAIIWILKFDQELHSKLSSFRCSICWCWNCWSPIWVCALSTSGHDILLYRIQFMSWSMYWDCDVFYYLLKLANKQFWNYRLGHWHGQQSLLVWLHRVQGECFSSSRVNLTLWEAVNVCRWYSVF